MPAIACEFAKSAVCSLCGLIKIDNKMFRKIARKRAIFLCKTKVFRNMQFQNIFNIKCKNSSENARCFCQSDILRSRYLRHQENGRIWRVSILKDILRLSILFLLIGRKHFYFHGNRQRDFRKTKVPDEF